MPIDATGDQPTVLDLGAAVPLSWAIAQVTANAQAAEAQAQASAAEADAAALAAGSARDAAQADAATATDAAGSAANARDAAITAEGAAQAARDAALADAATATTQAGLAATAAGTASGASQLAMAALAARAILPTAAAALPYEVSAVAGGEGTGSGGTPGEYLLVATGGPAGAAIYGTIDSTGKAASYRIASGGIATANTAPTLAWPAAAGITGATVPTATVSAIAAGKSFLAPDATSSNLLLWQNASGALAAVNMPNGGQTALPIGATRTPTLTGNTPGWLKVDLQAGTVSTSAAGYAAWSGGYVSVATGQSVGITGFSNAAAIQTIFVNMSTGAVGGIQVGAVPAGCLPVAIVQNGNLYAPASYSRTINPFTLVDSAGVTSWAEVTRSATVAAPAGFLTVNLATGTVITATGTAYAVWSGGYKAIGASQSVAITGFGSAASLQTIFVNMATGAVGGIQGGAVPANCVAVAVAFAGQLYPLASYSRTINPFTLVDSAGVTAFTLPTSGVSVMGSSAGWLKVNLQTGTVSTTASGYAAHPGGNVAIGNSQSVAITGFSNAAFLQTIYVNMASGAVGGVQGGAVPANCFPVAYVFNQALYPAAGGGGLVNPFTLVNSSGSTVGASSAKPFALVFNIGTINLSLATNQFTATGAYLATPDGLVAIPNQTITFPTQTGAGYLYCDASGTLTYANGSAVPVGNYPIMAVKLNPASALDCSALTFGQNVTFTDASGFVSVIGAQPGLKTFQQAFTRLVLPDDLFFVSGHSQPLFRNSYLCEADATLANACTLLLDTGLADTDLPIKGLSQVAELDPAALGTTARVVMTHPASASEYVQSLTVHTASAAAVSGTSPKILAIGDSIGMFGMLRAYQDYLISLGATPQFVGTFASAYNPSALSGNLAGEARGSWAYRSFVGRDTQAGGNTMTLATGATTTQFQNPFLRVATSTDLASNPTWCFAFGTNNYKNPSYAENATLGTYYIFDFAAYLAACSVPNPDAVVIALGDNDIIWGANGSPYTMAQQISEAAAALNIMVRQIRAALPGAKIIIAPLRARGRNGSYTNAFYTTAHLPLVEAIQTQIRALKTAGITGLTMVGTYAHTCRDHGFTISGSAALSAGNAEAVGTISDAVHYTTDATQTWAKKRVARTEMAALLCALQGV